MKILIDINHPADVHQFKNLIKKLLAKKHKVLITARNKDCTYQLLEKEKINFMSRKGYYGLFGKTIGMFLIDLFLYRKSCIFKPDLLIGSSGNCYIAQVSKLLRRPSLIFDDTEHSTIQNLLTFPFATKVITPRPYLLELGKKQIRYNGIKELAYLSPKYFKLNKRTINNYSINGKLIVVRLVSWDASHDLGKKGIIKEKIIDLLNKYGTVVISSELKITKKYQKYLIKDPNDLHHLLHYADLFLGEGASTAAEAAVLGTPSIYVNELKLGYINELIKHKLVIQTFNETQTLKKAIELLNHNSKRLWLRRKDNFLNKKIDVNKWMYNLISNWYSGLGMVK